MEDMVLGRVEVQRAGPILVAEGTRAVRIRMKQCACPRANLFTHLLVNDELDFERVRPGLFCVAHHRRYREYASHDRHAS